MWILNQSQTALTNTDTGKRHNGYIHHWHETTKDEYGNYVDSYTYEILRDESSNET